MSKFSILFLALILLATSCKKEEIKTKTDILCNRTWILEEYSKTSGGVITVYYKKGGSNNIYDYSKDTRNYIKDGTTTAISTPSGGLGYRGTWKFLSNETQMENQQTYPTLGSKRVVDITSPTENEFVYTEKNDEELYKSRYIPQQ
jgi:hypothetical protein